MIVDVSSMPRANAYHLMTQMIVPRPIAWVLTANEDGSSYNLAPFSYFNAVSSQPPLLMISVDVRPDSQIKDTRRNIERTEEFVVHVAADQQVAEVNASSASLAADVSEVDELGLELADFAGSSLPRVAGCPIALSCALHKIDMIAEGQALIFGRISSAWLADEITSAKDDRITVSADKMRPLGRLGAGAFARFGAALKLERPK